jgi:hypothetical protein
MAPNEIHPEISNIRTADRGRRHHDESMT